jgi:iron complex transport system ATP-binding protein
VAHGPPDTVLTEALIAQTYRVATHLGTTPAGQRFIIPTARQMP